MNQLMMERTTRTTRRPRGTAAVAASRVPRRTGADVVGRPAPGARPTARRPHEWRTLLAVSVGVLAVLLAATWSLAQGWGREPVVGPGELAVDGGVVRVDGVVSAARPQHAMPGMGADEDPVPDGYRRVSVDVTLMAGAAAMEYDAELFALDLEEGESIRLAHRDVLPGDVLPAGTWLAGTLLFDVPVDTTEASLTYDGDGATSLVLPAETEQSVPVTPVPATGEAGHGSAGHDATTPAPAEGTTTD